jgi:hypothetical protein
MRNILVIPLLLTTFTIQAQIFKAFLGSDGSRVDSVKGKMYVLYAAESDTTWGAELYSLDDKIISKGVYKDKELAIPNGKFYYYGQTHRLETTGNYINGARNGSWISYNTNGKKNSLSTYKDDMQNGLFEQYNLGDTTVQIRGNYVNGVRDGVWYVYSVLGNVLRTEVYQNDKIVNTIITPPDIISPVSPTTLGEYLAKNSQLIKYNTKGRLFINCTINTHGKLIRPSLANVTQTNDVGEEIKNNVLNSLATCTFLWAPAFNQKLNKVVDLDIAFVLDIYHGAVIVNYSPKGNALAYQAGH